MKSETHGSAGERGLQGQGWIPVGLGAAALAGVLLVLFSAWPWGVGVGYDSMFYLTAADSLVRGNGLRWMGEGTALFPLTHFPPLYPAALAGLRWLGLDMAHAAMIMNATLFGLSVGLLGLIAFRATKRISLGFAVAALALASPILLEVYLDALSEPLFLALLLIWLALLLEHLARPGWGMLAAAGCAAALAGMTRYVGLAVVGAGVLALLGLRHASIRRRVAEGALHALLGLLPLGLWAARNLAVAGSATNRSLIYHPIAAKTLRIGLKSVTGWFLPVSLPLDLRTGIVVLAVLVVGVAAAFGLRAWRQSPGGREMTGIGESPSLRLIVVLGFFGLTYGLQLLISLTFFDASTKLDDRILSPVYVAVLLGMAPLGVFLGGRGRWAGRLIWVWLMVFYIVQTALLAVTVREEGRGFNSRAWQASDTVALVRELPSEAIVVTNEPFPLMYLTSRPVYWMPEAIDSVKGGARPEYPEQMSRMRQRLREPEAYLVVFLGGHYRPEFPPLEELTAGLELLATTEDGAVYVDPANPDLSFAE